MAETKQLKSGYKYSPTVFDGYFFDQNGDLVFKAKANTDASVEIQSTKTEKKGGQGAATLWVINSDRTVTAKMTALDIQTNYITANLGTTAQIGKNTFMTNKNLKAKNGTITLPVIPADGKIVVDIKNNFVTVQAPSTDVDLSAYGVKDDCVNVTYFYVADGIIVPIPTNSAPMTGKLVLETPMFSSGVEVGSCGWQFNNFQLDGNMTHSTTASDSNTIEITGSALKDENSTAACEGNGVGDMYGYYFEKYIDPSVLFAFSKIIAAPDEIELSLAAGETDAIQVYGKKGAGFDNIALEAKDITFTSADTTIATVTNAGSVSPVAIGSTSVACEYDGMTATVKVDIVA